MNQIIAAVFLLLPSAALASDQSAFPAGYWERGYATYQQLVAYNLTLRVANLTKAGEDLDKRAAKAGATLTNLNNNQNYFDSSGQMGRQKTRNVSYAVEDAKAEKFARSLFDLGELQQYNAQRPLASSQLDEIRQKLKMLDEETSKNADALRNMPIASYFLNNTRSRLQQSRDSFENSARKASVNVILIEPAEAR